MKPRALARGVFILLFFAAIVWCEEYTIAQITNNNYVDSFPKIHNGQLTWEGIDFINSQIFLYDGAKITQLTNNPYGGSRPQINNGQVVWEEFVGYAWQIFLYDGSQVIRITNDYNSNSRPHIHNGKIAWIRWSSKGWEILIYDSAQSAKVIYSSPYWIIDSDIHSGQIVWYGYTAPNYMQIFLYDGSKVTQLTNTGYKMLNLRPQIYNGQVTWYGYDGNDYEIFFYDGTKITQLTNNNYDDYAPEIYNNQIVWYGYDGNDYEIFSYNGSQAIQIADNNYHDYVPQIYDGKITWYGYDGNDYEIFFYDGSKTAQLTNNNYSDSGPQIDGGQITWYGYDGNDYEIFLAKPKALLETLDGVDFSAGKEVSSDPERLASGGTTVKGTVTDGVTRLLLRLSLDKPQSVTFSLQGEGNPGEDGALRSIDGSQEGASITIDTLEVNGKQCAFAVYQAPENFVRANYEAEDKKVSERKISVKIKSDSSPNFELTEEIKLVRPPVILVHGLWSNSDMWWENGFAFSLADEWPGIWIFWLDYEETNDEEFEVNKYKVRDMIEEVRKQYRLKESYPEGIAMVQADVIGHSMGGLLARIWAGSGKKVYSRDDNFEAGDINKIITLDSPHYGSFFADAGISCLRGQHSKVADILFWSLEKSGHSLAKGAVEDLMTSSEPIAKMNSTEIITPAHTIVGEYLGASLAYYTEDDGTVKFIIEGLPLDYFGIHNLLIDEGYGNIIIPVVIYAGSDLIVSANSQKGGLDISNSSTFNHHHIAATTEGAANRVIELLNADTDSNLFNLGFPLNKNRGGSQ